MTKKQQTGAKASDKKLGLKRDTIKKLSTISPKDLAHVAGGMGTVSRVEC